MRVDFLRLVTETPLDEFLAFHIASTSRPPSVLVKGAGKAKAYNNGGQALPTPARAVPYTPVPKAVPGAVPQRMRPVPKPMTTPVPTPVPQPMPMPPRTAAYNITTPKPPMPGPAPTFEDSWGEDLDEEEWAWEEDLTSPGAHLDPGMAVGATIPQASLS